MGFWIFMLIMAVLIPAIMIIMGLLFRKAGPKKINYIYGYRTAMSMKNRDTWEFAHRYCGRYSLYLGLILLIPSAVPMLFLIGRSVELIGIVGTVICFVDMVPLFLVIFQTERELKRVFDENGNRKSITEDKH